MRVGPARVETYRNSSIDPMGITATVPVLAPPYRWRLSSSRFPPPFGAMGHARGPGPTLSIAWAGQSAVYGFLDRLIEHTEPIRLHTARLDTSHASAWTLPTGTHLVKKTGTGLTLHILRSSRAGVDRLPATESDGRTGNFRYPCIALELLVEPSVQPMQLPRSPWGKLVPRTSAVELRFEDEDGWSLSIDEPLNAPAARARFLAHKIPLRVGTRATIYTLKFPRRRLESGSNLDVTFNIRCSAVINRYPYAINGAAYRPR